MMGCVEPAVSIPSIYIEAYNSCAVYFIMKSYILPAILEDLAAKVNEPTARVV